VSKRTRIIVAIVSVVGAVIVLVLVFGGKPEVTPGALPEASDTTSAAQNVSPATKPALKMTEGQEQAVGKAQDYLSFMPFSQAGLQTQLVVFDHFTTKDAKFAVTHVTVDWDEQAVLKAQQYLSSSHFSRVGLTRQLFVFDKFSQRQADLAVKKAFDSAG
jgi:hypothetical protein